MAIFKESKKSLRWFLIVVGSYNVYSVISGLRSFAELPTLLAMILVISVIINLIVLYVGIRFYSLIQTSSGLLIKFFWFQVLWTVANAIYVYTTHLVNAGTLIFYGISVLITIVIINSIKKLAKENSGQAFSVPTPPVSQ
jgi:hypothetical protein